MRADELRQALKQEPFRPFRMRFGSGSVVRVQHPEMVAMTPSGRTAIVVTEPTPGGEDEGFQIVDLMLVESLEYDGASGNGAGPQENSA